MVPQPFFANNGWSLHSNVVRLDKHAHSK